MRDEWIIDVLADLKAFAAENGMAELAEHLDDTALIAAAALANRDRALDEGLALREAMGEFGRGGAFAPGWRPNA